MRLVYVVLLCVFFTACAQSTSRQQDAAYRNSQPDWVRGDYQRFPRHSYLIAHGVSANLTTAKQTARVELAGKFQSEIKSYIRTLQSMSAEDTESVGGAINTDAIKTQILEHAQIVEMWSDPNSGSSHVLMVLDRVKSGEFISEDIYRLDNQIQRYIEKANEQNDPLQQVAFARLAIAKQQQRTLLAHVLYIVKPTAVLLAAPWESLSIEKHIETAIAQTNIIPVASGESLQYLAAIRDGVQAAGFSVDVKQKPHYILKASFEQSQMRWQDGLYLLHGSLYLKLLDGQLANQVRGEIRWPIEVRAPDREQLPNELAQAIKTINQNHFRGSFLNIEAQ